MDLWTLTAHTRCVDSPLWWTACIPGRFPLSMKVALHPQAPAAVAKASGQGSMLGARAATLFTAYTASLWQECDKNKRAQCHDEAAVMPCGAPCSGSGATGTCRCG